MGLSVSGRVGVEWVAALLAMVVIAGCAGQAREVAQRSDGVSSQASPMMRDLLAGVPDDCRLVEPVGAPDDPTGEDEALGALVTSEIDAGADRGPLVAVEAGEGADVTVVAATLFDDRGYQSQGAVWVVEHGQRLSVTAANQTAAAISTSRLVAVDTAGEDPVADAVASAEDCSAAAAAELRPERPEPSPSMRPELMVVDPTHVTPGGTVALRFPEETGRGVAFQLDRRDGQEWSTRYWMTSDGNGGQPVTVAVGTDGYGVVDVGVAGPGPDHVQIPHDAAPGAYRICTANAGDEFCAPIQIIDEK